MSMLTWFVEAVIYNFEVQGKMVVMIFTRLIIQQEAKLPVSQWYDVRHVAILNLSTYHFNGQLSGKT